MEVEVELSRRKQTHCLSSKKYFAYFHKKDLSKSQYKSPYKHIAE